MNSENQTTRFPGSALLVFTVWLNCLIHVLQQKFYMDCIWSLLEILRLLLLYVNAGWKCPAPAWFSFTSMIHLFILCLSFFRMMDSVVKFLASLPIIINVVPVCSLFLSMSMILRFDNQNLMISFRVFWRWQFIS